MEYYDRKQNKLVQEIEYKSESLEFLYNTPFGRFLLKAFVARPWVSKLVGLYQKSGFSRKKIKDFVSQYNMNIPNDELKKYYSFNDFFTRKGTPIQNDNNSDLIAIADSKLSVHKITDDLRLNIKNSNYSIEEIVKDKEIAKIFAGGTCLVFRLCVDDMHHYFHIDDGRLLGYRKIRGVLHTVRPISEEYNVFSRNSREVNIMYTKHLGYVVQIEVGALLIGKIKNTHDIKFRKNEEKGYFEFGGSTIVVLIKKDVEIDDDILEQSKKGIETKVSAGEKIGTIPRNISAD